MSLLENELPSELSSQGTAGIGREDSDGVLAGGTAPGSSLGEANATWSPPTADTICSLSSTGTELFSPILK